MSAIDEVLDRNTAFQEGFADAGLQRPPARRIAIVACMDARLDPKGALGLAPGDGYILRVINNVPILPVASSSN